MPTVSETAPDSIVDKSPNTPDVASAPRLRLPAASGGIIRFGESNQPNLKRKVDFVAKAEDGVYSAAGFVKEEAETIEGIAEHIERFSTLIEEDVDKAQTFVHQVHGTAESMEVDVNQATASLLDASSRTEVTRTPSARPSVAKDFLDFGWGWNVLRIFLVVLTFVVVLLHYKGDVNLELFENESARQSIAGSSKTSTFTAFNMFVINLGPILRVLSFLKSIITREEKIFANVEDRVDEAARDVKKTVKTVEGVAHVVEEVSKRLEQDSDKVQTIITKVRLHREL